MGITVQKRRTVLNCVLGLCLGLCSVANAQNIAPTTPATKAVASSHYEPVLGKLVGILPDVWELDRLLELRLQYGFTGTIVVPAFGQYELSMQAGFTPEA